MNKRKLTLVTLIFGAMILITTTSNVDFSKSKIGAMTETDSTDIETDQTTEPAGEVNYFFTENNINVKSNDVVTIKVESYEPTKEVRLLLPEGVSISSNSVVNETVTQGLRENEWKISTETEATSFDIPLLFDAVGEYKISAISSDETLTDINVVVDGVNLERSVEESEPILEQEVVEPKVEDIQNFEAITVEESKSSRAVAVDVSTVTELSAAIADPDVTNIRLVSPIVVTTQMAVRTDKSIDLNGNTLTMNGTAEFRLIGNVIRNFSIENGVLDGTATTMIGDGQNGNPTAATRQLTGMETVLKGITVTGNNFYNALTTNVIIDGDVEVNVRNTGFRTMNFTVSSIGNLNFLSSGGTASGGTGQNNNTMQGITMGNYNQTGKLKRFLIEQGGYARIEVAAGGSYNNAVADFSHLDVYGTLNLKARGTAIRSTSSDDINNNTHSYVNIHPQSNFYAETTSNINTGLMFTYPVIMTIDAPATFDMIYLGNGRFFWPWAGSQGRTSQINFLNTDIAAWTNAAAGIGSPTQYDRNVGNLTINGLTDGNNGTITSSSPAFQTFNINNQSRMSNDISIPRLIPNLEEAGTESYNLPRRQSTISGTSKYLLMDEDVGTVPINAEVVLTVGGRTFRTFTNEAGDWEMPIDVSTVNAGVTGTLKITDETYRSHTVQVTILVRNANVLTEFKEEDTESLLLESYMQSVEIGTTLQLYSQESVLYDEGYDFVRSQSLSAGFNPDTNTLIVPSEGDTVTFYYKKAQGELLINYQDMDGNSLAPSEVIVNNVGEEYSIAPIDIEGYAFHGLSENSALADGQFLRESQEITFVYVVGEPEFIHPRDPLAPEIDVNPEGSPNVPGDQGLFSIDFISRLNFDTQKISTKERIYYANPQRLLDENGLVIAGEERPNYVQISDRRAVNERNGWELSVTQNRQFSNLEESLDGAQLSFKNQEIVSAGGILPENFLKDTIRLIPGVRQPVISATGQEGQGTFIYRFGNAETAGESVTLTVPGSSNPSEGTYNTSLTWEFLSVP